VSWNVGTSRDAAVSDIKLVYSKHGAKAKEYLDLRLTANVIPDFRFRPSELEFQYGIPSQRDVTIHPGRLNNVSLGDAYCTHRAFEVIVLPEKSAIRVNFNASEWHDDSTAELVVHVPGSTNQPKIAIPIQVTSEQE
jgi:hypothetical protein